MKKTLVIGFGSIGQRHARILKELGCEVTIVSQRGTSDFKTVNSLHKVSNLPDYFAVVVCSKTSQHAEDLKSLRELGFQGPVLVEKPLFLDIPSAPPAQKEKTYVAYNLRFHPIVSRLQSLLTGQKVISVFAYVGQYLPTWRSDRDYRTTYSAERSEGGGVLLDLSHEMDYLTLLFGGPTAVSALGGHDSHLEINSDDHYSLLWCTKKSTAIQLQMNYLDRFGRRFLVINCDKMTIAADFKAGEIRVDDDFIEELNC